MYGGKVKSLSEKMHSERLFIQFVDVLLLAGANFICQLFNLLRERMGFDAYGAALVIDLEAVCAVADGDIRDVAVIIANQPSVVRVEVYAVGILERTGVVHVNLVHTHGEYIQVVQYLIEVGLVAQLKAQDSTDDT